MRNSFAQKITELAEKDERIVMLMADIGNRLFDKYKEKFPKRFYNCGVAEANMISMAAGLASCGFRPVCYTITPFATVRCLEQIRIDLAYHEMPVLVVGTGSGLSYAALGATHHSCEDMAMLRVLPNMKVMCPGDAWELRACMQEFFKQDGPAYMRIGKKGEPLVHEKLPKIKIGKMLPMRAGKDVCILNAGNMLPASLEVADKLKEKKISAEVMSVHTMKPLDIAYLKKAFAKFKLVATVEEHSILGGLGGSVAEWLSEQGKVKSAFMRFGTADEFLHKLGEQHYARNLHGLSVGKITNKILKKLKK